VTCCQRWRRIGSLHGKHRCHDNNKKPFGCRKSPLAARYYYKFRETVLNRHTEIESISFILLLYIWSV